MALASGHYAVPKASRLPFSSSSASPLSSPSPRAERSRGATPLHSSSSSSSSSPSVRAQPCPANKRMVVFRDEANGIVCYRALETGEVTCEGFDEGPYFHPPPPHSTRRARQDLSPSKRTRCHLELKVQWDKSLQMNIYEGFDEG